jgi:enoyl-CoA hydratase
MLQTATRIRIAAPEAGVTIVQLDNPPANSLDADFYAELGLAITALEADAETRVVVFASSHPAIFLSGADLKQLGATALTAATVAERVDRAHAAFLRLQRISKPTIAAIEGHALGGGCEFVLALDFRFMTSGKARIGLPEILLGLIPAGGGTQRLSRLVGRARATELLMMGERLDADDAERIGLVTRATGDARATAIEYAYRLAELPRSSLSAIKLCLNDGYDSSLVQGLAVERAAAIGAFVQPEAAEGVAAFLAKRRARFREVRA